VGNSSEVAAQVSTSNDALVCFRGRGEVNEVRLDAGKSMVSSMNSIASRHNAESRLEDARAPVTFGLHWGARFSVKRFNPRASRGAPEQSKKNRLGEEALGSPSTSE
jgi:hypothetical protein